MQPLLLLALLLGGILGVVLKAPIVAGLAFTSPPLNATITKGTHVPLTWSTVDTDPDTFSIYLVNFVNWPPFYTPLALDIVTTLGAYEVYIPFYTAYRHPICSNAINGTNVYIIYAQSGKLTVDGSSCTDPSGAVIEPTCTATVSNSASTVLVTVSMCTTVPSSASASNGTATMTGSDSTTKSDSATLSSSSWSTKSESATLSSSSWSTKSDSATLSSSSWSGSGTATGASSTMLSTSGTNDGKVTTTSTTSATSSSHVTVGGKCPETIGWSASGYDYPVTLTSVPVASATSVTVTSSANKEAAMAAPISKPSYGCVSVA
ncbi:hypothetical protein HK405_015511 [Cladochytrium tenue]|nr:hypothetical protein HK405_015511 [Cladochytrium tenue]